MNPTGAKAYLQTKVTTTTPGDLVVLLFDGAIKYIKQAKSKIEEKDMAAKGILISKAMDIVAELDGSLNAQKGGNLAENLHKLYFYCSTRLLKANLYLDVKLLDEVIHILTGLSSAFREIADHERGVGALPPQQVGDPVLFTPKSDKTSLEAQAAQAVQNSGGYAHPHTQPVQAVIMPPLLPVQPVQPVQAQTPKPAPAPQQAQVTHLTPPVKPAAQDQPKPEAVAQPDPDATQADTPVFKPMSASALLKRKATAAYR